MTPLIHNVCSYTSWLFHIFLLKKSPNKPDWLLIWHHQKATSWTLVSSLQHVCFGANSDTGRRKKLLWVCAEILISLCLLSQCPVGCCVNDTQFNTSLIPHCNQHTLLIHLYQTAACMCICSCVLLVLTTMAEFLREPTGVVGREFRVGLVLNSSELRLSEPSLKPLLIELLSSQLEETMTNNRCPIMFIY